MVNGNRYIYIPTSKFTLLNFIVGRNLLVASVSTIPYKTYNYRVRNACVIKILLDKMRCIISLDTDNRQMHTYRIYYAFIFQSCIFIFLVSYDEKGFFCLFRLGT